MLSTRPLPTHLWLFGRKWKIRLTHELGATESNFGRTTMWSGEIVIDGGLNLNDQWSTLCHEVLHVISMSLSLDFDEATVNRTGAGLWEFVRTLL